MVQIKCKGRVGGVYMLIKSEILIIRGGKIVLYNETQGLLDMHKAAEQAKKRSMDTINRVTASLDSKAAKEMVWDSCPNPLYKPPRKPEMINILKRLPLKTKLLMTLTGEGAFLILSERLMLFTQANRHKPERIFLRLVFPIAVITIIVGTYGTIKTYRIMRKLIHHIKTRRNQNGSSEKKDVLNEKKNA